MCIKRETKWYPFCCCHDNGFAAGAVLIKTEIPGFVLKQEPSTPPNLMMEVKTIRELCLFEGGPFGSLWRLQMGIFTFLTERDWIWKRCYSNSTEGVILYLFWCTSVVPSFQNTASIFPEISFIQYFPLISCKQWSHHWSNLHNRETSISLKRKKIFQKEKHHSSVFWKAFQISTNYFSLHRHLNLTWSSIRLKLHRVHSNLHFRALFPWCSSPLSSDVPSTPNH